MRKLKDDAEALAVAYKIINAQVKLMAALRSGTRQAPGGALNALDLQVPRLEEYRERTA